MVSAMAAVKAAPPTPAKRMLSLNMMRGRMLTGCWLLLLSGEKLANGGKVSDPPNELPSKVKLSKRLLPTVPPEP